MCTGLFYALNYRRSDFTPKGTRAAQRRNKNNCQRLQREITIRGQARLPPTSTGQGVAAHGWRSCRGTGQKDQNPFELRIKSKKKLC